MRVAIRVDASTTIGLGHVKRCLSLAADLQDAGSDVRFVTRNLGVQSEFGGHGVSMLQAPQGMAHPFDAKEPAHASWAEVPWELDARETAEALASQRTDWVVVDHYAFDARWHGAVAASLECRVAVIDDLGDRDLAADLLIDHNHCTNHRAKYGHHIQVDTMVLGGPHYALLGKPYRSTPRCAVREKVESIGIFMGGADKGDFSSLALLACRQHAAFSGRIDIATTSSNPHLADLRSLAARWPDTHVIVDLPHLADFFARHDMQVGAGGGATWERCAVGAPSLALIVADNQRQVLEPIESLGVLRCVAQTSSDPSALGREIRAMIDNQKLRAGLAERASRLVDGWGAHRVAQKISQTCIKSASSAPTQATR